MLSEGVNKIFRENKNFIPYRVKVIVPGYAGDRRCDTWFQTRIPHTCNWSHLNASLLTKNKILPFTLYHPSINHKNDIFHIKHKYLALHSFNTNVSNVYLSIYLSVEWGYCHQSGLVSITSRLYILQDFSLRQSTILALFLHLK